MSEFSSSAVSRYPRKDHLQSWLHSWVEGGSIAGASALVYHGDEEVCYYQSGHADVANRLPISRDTIFRVYSMTKPITCLAALILIDRGLLLLDDPIEKWIPAFRKQMKVYVSGEAENLVTTPAVNKVTVRNLMTHTSGMTYGFLGTHPCDKILLGHLGNDLANWFRNTSLAAVCEAISNTPLCFEPGTRWHYGFSTDVLGHVVEIVSGMDLSEFFQKEIFGPLGMVDTGFYVPVEKIHRLSQCYTIKGANAGYVLSTSPEIDRSIMPTFLAGGGGLVSTIDDYMIFARLLLQQGQFNGRRLLSLDSMRLLNENHLIDGKDIEGISFNTGFSETVGAGIGFGLGVSVVTSPSVARGASLSGVGEFGWGGMASTWFTIDPAKNLAVVFMTQMIPSSVLPLRSHLRWLAHWIVEKKINTAEQEP